MSLAVGVDVHKLEHFAAAVDELGRRVDRLTFATTAKGHERFIAWLGALPSDHVLVGIENAGGYGITRTVAPETVRRTVCEAEATCVGQPGNRSAKWIFSAARGAVQVRLRCHLASARMIAR